MKVEHSFSVFGDRYIFDFDKCTYARGWFQVDTRQDASYYGNWLNPSERKFKTYAEGDVSDITFDSDEEMVEWVRSFAANEGLGFMHIDPGLRPESVDYLRSIGLGDFLPKSLQKIDPAKA
jgi:hypothetical protein